MTGEPCNGKLLRTVWRGTDGKGFARIPRQLSTLRATAFQVTVNPLEQGDLESQCLCNQALDNLEWGDLCAEMLLAQWR